VLADGYYEWQRDGKVKLPWLYEVDGGPFVIAGLWEGETCALLTTDANKLAAQVQDRMPVILDPEDYDAWLACERSRSPFDSERMTARPISTTINNVRNQGPQCVEPR
jgi:putative SOS response-associated peptidase YedK